MPQGVSAISSPSSSGVQSNQSWSNSQGSDGGSFSNALDRAKNADSAASKDTSTETPTAKTTSGKASIPGKPSRKAGSQVDGADTNSEKSQKAPTVSAQPLNPDSQDSNADPGKPSDQGKPPKKGVAPAVTLDANVPAAVVQLQGDAAAAKPAVGAQPTADAARKAPLASENLPQSPGSVKPIGTQPADPSATQTPASAAAGTTANDANAPAPVPADARNSDNSQAAKPKIAIQPKQSPDSQANGNVAANPAPQGLTLPDAANQDGSLQAPSSPVETPAASTRITAKQLDDALLQGLSQGSVSKTDGKEVSTSFATVSKDLPPPPPEAQFAAANHANIVSGIQAKLLPGGGSMSLHLDPPELGALQIRVEMKGGVMTASFETSSDQTAKLLSHSLTDLKTSLEAQGVTVEKIHVTQVPRQQSSSSDSHQDTSDKSKDTAAQQEQQRKDMVRRMWRKLMKGQDPVDLVA
jgi:flagellar hook-length control protein FliK